MGDFAGGLASRRGRVITTLASIQWLGLAFALVMVTVSREAAPITAALAWGAAAGISSTAGLALFFRAMSSGTMSVVAPVAALVSASVPVLVGLLRGERLATTQVVGIVLALVAVTMISRPARDQGAAADGPGAAPPRRVLPLALVAGLGFAAFYLFIDQARLAGAAEWWPIVAARGSGSALVLGWVVATRTVPRAPLRAAPLLALAALGDTGGIVLFSFAIASGPLSIAAVLSSLYPVTTVILAWLLLRERLGRTHAAAVVLALVAVVLIAA